MYKHERLPGEGGGGTSKHHIGSLLSPAAAALLRVQPRSALRSGRSASAHANSCSTSTDLCCQDGLQDYPTSKLPRPRQSRSC